MVSVNYSVEMAGMVLESGSCVQWMVGGEETVQSPWAGRLEAAVCSMRVGTRAKVELRGEYAAEEATASESQPCAICTIELVELASYKATPDEVFDFACMCRAAGNTHFRAGCTWRALQKYEHCLEVIARGRQEDAQLKDRVRVDVYFQLRRDVLLNISACSLLLALWRKAEHTASMALELDPGILCTALLSRPENVNSGNLKGLLRRSRALAARTLFHEAKVDLEELLRIDPRNTTAIKELKEIKKARRRQVRGEREFFTSFYDGYRKGQCNIVEKDQTTLEWEAQLESQRNIAEEQEALREMIQIQRECELKEQAEMVKRIDRIKAGDDYQEIVNSLPIGPMRPPGSELGGVIKKSELQEFLATKKANRK